MTEMIPTNPAPTAVPWTPDMMTPDAPVRAPMQNAAPLQSQAHPAVQLQPQPAPYQTAPQYQPAQQMPQAYAPQLQPQMPPAQAPHVQVQPAPFPPAGQPQQQGRVQQSAPLQHAPITQPVHHRQQPMPPQMIQTSAPHMTGQPSYAPPQQPQYAQPGPPPPLPQSVPQMQNAVEQELTQAPGKSKSFIANLLKRSPKPAPSETTVLPAKSESLFNKNFVLGAVTGLLIGAFFLPMAMNVLGGGTAAQTQAQAEPIPAFEPMPAATDGDTFIDNAIASETP